jgi:hypothetical protein
LLDCEKSGIVKNQRFILMLSGKGGNYFYARPSRAGGLLFEKNEQRVEKQEHGYEVADPFFKLWLLQLQEPAASV